jgi:hypothetical protein
MYASNLQKLLFNSLAHSDFSPQSFANFTERFNQLRNYGHLPRGRDQRKRVLTPTQVALAILGLVPTAPQWAGHGATVLRNFSPVGGLQGGLYETQSLVDAITLLLTNKEARENLLTLQILVGETATNSSGAAVFAYDRGGVRRHAYYMPQTAVSLSKPGAELSFDLERHVHSAASRSIIFDRKFFDRISREMTLATIHLGEPIGDGSEYDEEETQQAYLKKLGVTPRSRFLNMAADNHVTWPKEPTLVKFGGHHFILMPRTKENIQSVHIDLSANALDDAEATTVIRRFLSIMSWCDNQFAALGFGWSGTTVPVAVSKPELAFRTTSQYIFDRKMLSDPKALRALALYREALNAEHNNLISYAVLNYYKIIELTQSDRGSTKAWFRNNFDHVRRIGRLKRSLDEFDNSRGATAPHEYIYKSCRIAVAHAGKDSESDPDDATELYRLHVAADIMQALAHHLIETEFKISGCIFDGT